MSESFTLLHLASYFGILPLAEKLVLAKGLMDKTKCLYYLRKHDYHGMTALMWAANRGHEAVVRLLLEQGANIDAKDEIGETALMRAAHGGTEIIVRLHYSVYFVSTYSLLSQGLKHLDRGSWKLSARVTTNGNHHTDGNLFPYTPRVVIEN